MLPTQLPPISEIVPGIFIGTFEASKDIKILMTHDITAMVSLGQRRALEWDRVGNRMLVPEADHLIVPCTDMPGEDILAKLPDICDFIDRHLDVAPPSYSGILDSPPLRAREDGLEDLDVSSYFAKHNVLVHCNLGVSRSAAMVAGYLMRKKRKGRDQTLACMRKKRRVMPIQSFLDQLQIWEDVEYDPWEDKARKVPKKQYILFLESLKEETSMVRSARETREEHAAWLQGDDDEVPPHGFDVAPRGSASAVMFGTG